MNCKNCGKEIQNKWKVCPFCKEKIEQEWICSDCGLKIKEGWKPCQACGNTWFSGTDLANPSDLENGIDMIFVEGGSFIMGSDDKESQDIDQPLHKVTLDSFYISNYLVTQKQYSQAMGYNPAENNRSFDGSLMDQGIGPIFPVYNLNWYDAVEFCNKLSEYFGLDKCYDGSGDSIKCDFAANGYRLPTEAEWEYAARGGKLSKNYKYAGSNYVHDVAYYGTIKTTRKVGRKKPNELGIYDMSGNVSEWCWDLYGEYSCDEQYNPQGPEEETMGYNGIQGICRGGNYLIGDFCYRSTYRNKVPKKSKFCQGVRLARTTI